ncbi:hypothetical protein EAD89_16445 [Micromonospora sp. BL4]|uniref:DUF6361 family protein n=1 Tax=Micromonospora sp. BL4 TaxID=2478710 RepID=UPI000EF5A78C|nr:DUF6361 family protein [Micromonospora sp. BL4]RLP88627.1 hypothetical protein EAD89_16445 [Micromonospora sp. BL4]
MISTSAVSTISWLDMDDDQSRRIREAIAALDDKETFDPIGTGTIRDAFSEALFPGTSTIQTRLRYFLFVPWTCYAVAAKRPSRKAFQDRLREQEWRLIEALRPIGANQGVIGYRAGRKLTRLPASVYWHGLGAWGVRTQPRMTLADYRDLVTRPGRGDRTIRDDENVVLGGPPAPWDPGLPDPPDEYPATGLSMQLTRDEACYLRDRMRSTRAVGAGQAGAPSMLACLAEDPAAWYDQEEPWSESLLTLPAPVSEMLTHARNFSDITFGAQLLYNVLLSRRAAKLLCAETSHLDDWVASEIDAWIGKITARSDSLQDWWSRSDAFWGVVSGCRGRARPGTRAFLEHWIGAAVKDPRTALEDAGLRRRVTEQELALKGRYARLSYQPALQSWDGDAIGGAPLRYRWPTVRQFLSDLQGGLAGKVADGAA